ncbi:tetratricopeptide repeat protein [Methylocapsa sp. S129]|uniref:tetratricopeptide repeat protein n=1 Tax=Methylocapsa sp. S129 TaxID=1641869 RepID=UPI00131D63B6|nr:tetratricopeptide repeat protein [Methylocapsa sp. S129]
MALSLLLTGAGASAVAEVSGADAFARRDYPRAAAAFMRLAERGDPQAQTYLGYLYAKGRGVPHDDVLAAQWLTRAANQGLPTAQFMLGLMYDKGLGLRQDFTEAYFWLDLATAHAGKRELDYWTRIRNAIGSKIMRWELTEAQERASYWRPLPER